MSIEVAELAEHELDATVVLIVRRAEQWVVVLLRLRADLRIIDLEHAATSDVAASECVERTRPLRAIDRVDHRRIDDSPRLRHRCAARNGEYAARGTAKDSGRDTTDEQPRHEAVSVASRRDEISVDARCEGEQLRGRITLE